MRGYKSVILNARWKAHVEPGKTSQLPLQVKTCRSVFASGLWALDYWVGMRTVPKKGRIWVSKELHVCPGVFVMEGDADEGATEPIRRYSSFPDDWEKYWSMDGNAPENQDRWLSAAASPVIIDRYGEEFLHMWTTGFTPNGRIFMLNLSGTGHDEVTDRYLWDFPPAHLPVQPNREAAG